MKVPEKYFRFDIFSVLLLVVSVLCCNCKTGAREFPGIIPQPRIEIHGHGIVQLAGRGEEVSVFVSNADALEANPVTKGFDLFSERMNILNGAICKIAKVPDRHPVFVDNCTEQEMAGILEKGGAKEKVEWKRLTQAYFLEIKKSSGKNPGIIIRACSDLGLFYGLVSLCQLAEADEKGNVFFPEIRIIDWPETGFRLAKTSASNNPLNLIEIFADWMPLYKVNMAGLQFHGEESKKPGVFLENVKEICMKEKKSGLLETVVYFCPFRGEGFDFRKHSDQDEYARLLSWFLDQGADGIEVDYNDWPGKDLPIEDVINLACRALEEKNPEAYIFYCPPTSGPAQYRGAATPEMGRTLSNVPVKVWPLWTGMTTLITDTLKPEQVEQWTKIAGHRPFFWINRSSVGVDKSFSRPLQGFPDALVFPGELLPVQLNRLFEGIHLNFVFSEGKRHTLPDEFSMKELVYFATAADFIWNPQDWKANDSYKRAERFVRIMKPLVPDTGNKAININQ